MARFFVPDLGPAQVANMCPYQPQAFQNVTTCQVLRRRSIFVHFFFLNEPVPCTQSTPTERFAQIFEVFRVQGQYQEKHSAKKRPSTETKWLQSNHANCRWFLHKDQMFTPFQGDRCWKFCIHTCSVSPCRPVTERLSLFCFAGNLALLMAQIFKTKWTAKYQT